MDPEFNPVTFFCNFPLGFPLNRSFEKVRHNTPKQFIRLVRIVKVCPRHDTIIGTKLLIKMVKTMACLLANTNTLLQQIAHVLNVTRPLAQEATLNGILERVVVGLLRSRTETMEILENFLLDLQSRMNRLNWVDGVIRPLDVGRRDIAWLGSAAALD
jgi:hypothetical protein